MEQVFEMKVKEKTQKLKDSEADLQRRHEQTIRSLEAQKLEIEEKRKAFESEKASWEHASGLTLDELRRRSLEASSREGLSNEHQPRSLGAAIRFKRSLSLRTAKPNIQPPAANQECKQQWMLSLAAINNSTITLPLSNHNHRASVFHFFFFFFFLLNTWNCVLFALLIFWNCSAERACAFAKRTNTFSVFHGGCFVCFACFFFRLRMLAVCVYAVSQ